MRFLLSGSSGFIGHALSKALLNQEHSVLGIDNHSPNYNPKVKEFRLKDLEKYENFKFIKEDLLAPKLTIKLQREKVDYFIHLATKDFLYESREDINYMEYLQGTVMTTAKAFELAKNLGVRRFIFFSTASIYGTTKKKVYTEKDLIPNPASPQGASKLAAEQTVKYLSKLYYIPAVVLRVSTTYGPFMRPYTLIPHLINKINKGLPVTLQVDKKTKRDFVHIDDVVRYTLAVIGKRLNYQVINIASGKATSIENVSKIVAKSLNKNFLELNFVPEQNMYDSMIFRDIKIDIDKAKKMLKVSPEVSLSKGLDDTVKWYFRNKEILRFSVRA